MIDIEQPTCEKLTIDWGLSPQDNSSINELLDEIRNAEQQGERFNPAMVQELIQRLVEMTGKYLLLGTIVENCFIWHLTGKGNSANQATHLAPFISPEILRTLIDLAKRNYRRNRQWQT